MSTDVAQAHPTRRLEYIRQNGAARQSCLGINAALRLADIADAATQ